jgi:N-acetyl-anhydromuramyl-L-alanine amidase AmpD
METQTFKNLSSRPRTNNPNRIVVHHTGGTDKYPLADTSHHTAKIIEKWHLSKPGWIGIGYHYVIHKDGTVWKGRPEHVHGAHAKARNNESIGICLSGNFDLTLPTKEQEDALRTLMLDIKSRYTIEDIEPHRATANKTCYGNKLSEDWARNLVAEEVNILLKDATLYQVVIRLMQLLPK